MKKSYITGFTLVELLASIFIIILMTGIIFANYRSGRQEFALQRAASKVTQDIRRIQEMAMSIKECPIAICGGPPAEIPPRYAVEFSLDNLDGYFLFADRNDNGTYQTGGSKPDKVLEEITLEEGVKINQIFCGPNAKNTIWISFKSPDPKTEIRHPGECLKSAKIHLINTDNQIKIVSVNTVGLIEIE